MKYDAIIIGGGAAGLFCAIQAGKRGRKTLVIEHNAQVGRKILISGGGRCNFTNIDVSSENFVSANPHFCKSALARFTPQDFTDLVKKHRIQYYEKTLGQLFCRESSRLIVEMLVAECEMANVDIQTDCSVKNVEKKGHFEIDTSRGRFTSESLVIATGGFSFPKIGATGFGFKIAKQFSIERIDQRPSLVALVSTGKSNAKLAGISVDSNVWVGKHAFRENILFTHRGLSGPAVLQISNYWQKDKPVSIDLLPKIDIGKIMSADRDSRQQVGNYLSRFLPARFIEQAIDGELFIKPLYQLSSADIDRITDRLNKWQIKFKDTEGYDRAEVTLGGVSTNELSSQTMESKKVPGLYFIGEVVDVTGWLGGYNFQWAWASGFAAGQKV